MRRGGILGAAVAAVALAAPAAAQATTYTVDASAAAGCDATTHVCKTIGNAAAVVLDGDTVSIKPGLYAESPTFNASGITITGEGAASVRIDGTLTLTAGGTVRRIEVLPTATNAAALVLTSTAARTYTVESCVLSGEGTGVGLHVSDSGALNTISATIRHATIADHGSAPAVTVSNGIGSGNASATFSGSIVHGSRSTSGGSSTITLMPDTDTSTANPTLFFRPAQDNFHLRADSPARGAGGDLASGEVAFDIDGHPRPATGTDQGADQYVNHSPDEVVAAPSNSAPQIGEPVTFDGSASTDSDPVDVDGGIVAYGWDFADGSQPASGPVVTHAFSTAGDHSATLYMYDGQGALGLPVVTVHVNVQAPSSGGGGGGGGSGGGGSAPDPPDHAGPALRITLPRSGQVISLTKLGRRSLILRGYDSDDSGVQLVDVALVRRRGAACLFYDGSRSFQRRACANPAYLRTTVDDFTWSYALPGRFKPPPGTYEVRARALDIVGNVNDSPSAASRTLVTFRIAA